MTLKIELAPEFAQRLEDEAARCGQAATDFARAAIEEKLDATSEASASALYAGLPRHDPSELVELARQQGAPLAARFEDLLGDFWPEDESTDEFLATLRDWRRENPGALA